MTNSGGPPPGTFDTATDEKWIHSYELTFLSATRLIRLVLPGMKDLQVNETVNIPLVIHDYPAVTGITMSVELIAKMVEQGKNLNYLKVEDPPTGAKMQALAKLAGPDLKVFGALGGMYALEELELGAVGIMTGFVFAGLLVELYDLVQSGKMDKAAELFYDFVPFNRWEFQRRDQSS